MQTLCGERKTKMVSHRTDPNTVRKKPKQFIYCEIKLATHKTNTSLLRVLYTQTIPRDQQAHKNPSAARKKNRKIIK